MFAHRLVTAPTTEPVLLEEARTHLRVTSNAEDDYISGLIRRARQLLEEEYRLAFITQTWKLYLDEFPAVIRVPRPQLISVTSIEYVDTAGATQTLASAAYQVDTISEPGRIVPAYGYAWPSTRDQPNAVIVTHVSGYGAAAAVPEPIRGAILLRVADLFEHRADVVTGVAVSSIGTVQDLMNPYTVHWHPE